MEHAELAEELLQTLPNFNPCSFRPIRVIRDKAVQPRPQCSANSAPSLSLRELLTVPRQHHRQSPRPVSAASQQKALSRMTRMERKQHGSESGDPEVHLLSIDMFNEPRPVCEAASCEQLTQRNGARRGRRGIAAGTHASASVQFPPHPRNPRQGGSTSTAVLCVLCGSLVVLCVSC